MGSIFSICASPTSSKCDNAREPVYDPWKPLNNTCFNTRYHSKKMLLNNESFVGVLLGNLLIDEEHPVRSGSNRSDFERIKAPVQRDFAEAIQQLAVFPLGRAALLQHDVDGKHPNVVDSLQEVVRNGWSSEARRCAEGALVALSDSELHHDIQTEHIMMSYQVRYWYGAVVCSQHYGP